MYAGSGTRVLRKLDGRQRTVAVQNEFWNAPPAATCQAEFPLQRSLNRPKARNKARNKARKIAPMPPD